jgi:hypothetical protein
MTVRLSTGARTLLAGASGFAEIFEKGVIEIYTGTQPITADSAASGTLLGTVTLGSGAFTPGSPTNGLTFAAPIAGAVSKTGVWSMNGVAAGTAGYFRLKANGVDAGTLSTSLPRMDGSVAVSGGDLNLSNIAIAIGAPTTIDTFNWTIPAQ